MAWVFDIGNLFGSVVTGRQVAATLRVFLADRVSFILLPGLSLRAHGEN